MKRDSGIEVVFADDRVYVGSFIESYVREKNEKEESFSLRIDPYGQERGMNKQASMQEVIALLDQVMYEINKNVSDPDDRQRLNAALTNLGNMDDVLYERMQKRGFTVTRSSNPDKRWHCLVWSDEIHIEAEADTIYGAILACCDKIDVILKEE